MKTIIKEKQEQLLKAFTKVFGKEYKGRIDKCLNQGIFYDVVYDQNYIEEVVQKIKDKNFYNEQQILYELENLSKSYKYTNVRGKFIPGITKDGKLKGIIFTNKAYLSTVIHELVHYISTSLIQIDENSVIYKTATEVCENKFISNKEIKTILKQTQIEIDKQRFFKELIIDYFRDLVLEKLKEEGEKVIKISSYRDDVLDIVKPFFDTMKSSIIQMIMSADKKAVINEIGYIDYKTMTNEMYALYKYIQENGDVNYSICVKLSLLLKKNITKQNLIEELNDFKKLRKIKDLKIKEFIDIIKPLIQIYEIQKDLGNQLDNEKGE